MKMSVIALAASLAMFGSAVQAGEAGATGMPAAQEGTLLTGTIVGGAAAATLLIVAVTDEGDSTSTSTSTSTSVSASK